VKKLIEKPFVKITGGMVAFPLIVMFFLYFFDEFDTAAFGVLAPEIQKAFHLNDNRFGEIVILNLSVVLLFSVVVGYYGDRLPRNRLVVAGAIVAGTFSFGTGLASATWMLILMRIGNGVGVLVNDPIHRSLLTDYYKPEDRPAVFALHGNAARYGSVFGPMAAGIVGSLFGWRWAFVILIVPIFAMAYVARKMQNPIRGATDDPESAELAAEERAVAFGRGARILFAVKTLRRQFLAWLFIGAGLLPLSYELPLYYKRAFGLTPLERGALTAVAAAAGIVGVQVGGRLTVQWLAKGLGVPLQRAGWSLVVVGPGLALLAWAPTLWIAIPVAVITTGLAGLFTPAFYTTQAMVSPARVRSMSFSFGSVFIVAGVWALFFIPGVAGISDHSGIRWGILALAPYWVIGGLVLSSGHRFVAEDAQRSLEVLQTTAELRRQRLSASTNSILVVRGLDVSYGPVQVLFGVNFELEEGEIIALLGTNGAGKSTLLKAISGLVPMQSGAIYFDGDDVTGLEPEDSFALGMVQVPGGRGVFPGLTVKENLEVAAWASRRPRAEVDEAIKEVLQTFPSLQRRYDQQAGVLSGGEQQMLTLSQAFIAKPKLLMIDELSLGLAPIVVEDLLRIVRRIHDEGTAVILVEQSVNIALTVAHRALFMEKGEVRFQGATEDLLHRDDILRAVFLSGASALEEVK
jgi:branched-chain amino acid transport system ATP-binding protein